MDPMNSSDVKAFIDECGEQTHCSSGCSIVLQSSKQERCTQKRQRCTELFQILNQQKKEIAYFIYFCNIICTQWLFAQVMVHVVHCFVFNFGCISVHGCILGGGEGRPYFNLKN